MATNSNTTSSNSQLLLSTRQGPVMANNSSSSSLDMATPRLSLKDGRAKIILMNSDVAEASSGSSSQIEEQPRANGEIEDDEGEEGYSEPVIVKTVRSTSLDVTGNFHALEQDEYQIRKSKATFVLLQAQNLFSPYSFFLLCSLISLSLSSFLLSLFLPSLFLLPLSLTPPFSPPLISY